MPLIPLSEIEDARRRIAPYIRQTPLVRFDELAHRSQREVLLKCETLQRTGSFKPRGAANCILQNLAHAKKSGVITTSAGNHAQGVAMVSNLLGIKSTIVMPTHTPAIKVQNTQRWGAEVVLYGNVFDEAFEHASRLATEKGLLFIHAFKDPMVMAGQGTIGLELVEHPDFADVEAVVIPVGGGGLATGIASVLRVKRPDIKIYGVTPRNSPAFLKSFVGKTIVEEDVRYTLAEGTAFKRPDQMMMNYLYDSLDDVFSLTEESIATAISLLAEHAKLVVEGSGALSVSAVLENLVPEKKIAVILAGGNIDLPTLTSIVQRGLVEQGRLVRLVITISDRPGGLHAVTGILARERANILQVFHQRATVQMGIGEAEIDVDVETRGKDHTQAIIAALREGGFPVHCQ